MLAPVVIPANEEPTFDTPRVSRFAITQDGVGKPVKISYTLARYSEDHGDAPKETEVTGNTQKSLAEVMANPELAAAIAAVTGFCVAEAIEAGLVQPQ